MTKLYKFSDHFMRSLFSSSPTARVVKKNSDGIWQATRREVATNKQSIFLLVAKDSSVMWPDTGIFLFGEDLISIIMHYVSPIEHE